MSAVLDAYPWVGDSFADVRADRGGRYVTAACPLKCHRTATLSFWLGDDGRLMFGCWAGCDKLEVLRCAGAGWRNCFPEGVIPETVRPEPVAHYPYTDEAGTVLYETVRLEPGRRGRDKEFRQRRPLPGGAWAWNLDGVRRVLYRLPELRAADPEQPVFVVAGEKDADNLRALGLVATTNVCGERSEWLDAYTGALTGRDVAVVEDRDSAGRRHANEVCGSLLDSARSLRRVRFPAAKDTTAFLSRLRMDGVRERDELRARVFRVLAETPYWIACEVEHSAG